MESRMALEHSFWLVPAEPLRTRLHAVISNLAKKFDAVEFEPHVTIWCGVSDDPGSQKVAAALVDRFSAIELTPATVGYTEEYTKTLFIELEQLAAVRRMFEAIGELSATPSAYVLNPHLSLMYKAMPLGMLQEISETLELPDGTYRFDRLRVIETEIPLTRPGQVRNWRTVFDNALKP